jgi:glycosyltransferase involved in cell wall biosynthesis
MDGEPLVSVVTPFHDTAAYLPECIESVLAQDYPCLEYVLVDNWSRDGSGEIARRYAERDRRLRVLRPPRLLEQVPNYNFALSQVAPGARYVKLAQADDWLFPNCLSAMVDVAERNPRVGIVGGYALRETEVVCDGLPYPSTVRCGREVCRLQLQGKLFVFGTPSTVLYRADVVRARRPFFSETSLHEDTEACYEILREWDFGFVHQVLTFWRMQEGSITARAAGFNPNALDGYVCARKFGPEFLEGAELADALLRAEHGFYSGLADAAFRLEGRAFWRYQRDGLARAGLRLERAKLAKQLLLRAAWLAFNPLASLRGLRSRRERRRRRV